MRSFDYTDDQNRFVENLRMSTNIKIVDKGTFMLASEQYIGESQDVTPRNKSFLDGAFAIYRRKFKGVDKRDLHKEARGKSLSRDKRFTAKTVVTSKEEYIKRGAARVDLDNYDTAKKIFNFIGIQKKRTVKARLILTKRGRRYIDKRGRYVSVKRKT